MAPPLPFDEAPEKCEGCERKPAPPIGLFWHAILRAWLCIDCKMSFANWEAGHWEDEEHKAKYRPNCVKRLTGETGGEDT